MLIPDRRRFLQTAPLAALAADAVSKADKDSSVGPRFRLGLVTYNTAAKWDLPTLLKVCKDTGISPVELRTTHDHGVEPSLQVARGAHAIPSGARQRREGRNYNGPALRRSRMCGWPSGCSPKRRVARRS